ncbi:hypothetical protein KQI88_05665 [Alkaliphilus sp. MSJ-5]|uniref:Uncharacterized protein n=1 Tax=Alkaliphilus flagellatus TaxID=2841507 RepID=A0ABS6G080_9FIRM|nr:hypothetical protein [Alkaliphilus flagellatus]MBU5675895.1 hypothetical protein [Alkaliphilus flagellatus]
MTSEYVVNRHYTLKQVRDINRGMEECLFQHSTQTSLANRIIAGGITGIGLWVTAPVSVVIANLVAGLVFQTLSDVPNSNSIMKNGHYDMLRIETIMSRNGYTECKVRIAVLKKDNVEIFQAVMPTAYLSNGVWMEIE